MWQSKYEKAFPGLTKEDVWLVWQDVNHWQVWDKDIESAELKGPFANEETFVLKPKGGPKVTIRLVECIPHKGFTDVTRFPLAKMFDIHEIEETGDGVKLLSTIRVEGLLAWLWRKLVAQNVAAGVPAQMEALAKFAKSNRKAPA